MVSHGLGRGSRQPPKQPKWKQQQRQPEEWSLEVRTILVIWIYKSSLKKIHHCRPESLAWTFWGKFAVHKCWVFRAQRWHAQTRNL
jgi:hypothetical protein